MCKDELLLNHSFRLTIAWTMLAAMMVSRESFRRKKSGHSHQKKRAMLLIKRTVWNIGNIKKKGSWEQSAVASCGSAAITQEPKLLLYEWHHLFYFRKWENDVERGIKYEHYTIWHQIFCLFQNSNLICNCFDDMFWVLFRWQFFLF